MNHIILRQTPWKSQKIMLSIHLVFFFLRFVLPNAGAVGCLDCTCSSAEGIHGETRRTTFQQRHFVTDPSPNGAVGTSSAIVQTRNWRFCQLAVVSWLICSFSHCKKTV